jgi:hypothetical protein
MFIWNSIRPVGPAGSPGLGLDGVVDVSWAGDEAEVHQVVVSRKKNFYASLAQIYNM